MFGTKVFSAVFALVSLWTLNAHGKAAFKQNPIPLTATVGKFFDLDLKTLLDPAVVPTGKLLWGTTNKPAWLTLDSASDRLFGTPATADAGVKSFNLSVADADTGALATVNMTVVIPITPPIWASQDIDLGIQNE